MEQAGEGEVGLVIPLHIRQRVEGLDRQAIRDVRLAHRHKVAPDRLPSYSNITRSLQIHIKMEKIAQDEKKE